MGPPARLTVPTCIGCGAMGVFGSCETGCSERKLELVPAAAHDALVELGERAEQARAACERVAGELLRTEPSEPAYRRLQSEARRVLSTQPALDDGEALEVADTTITWWCERCGGLDAPQPCLGVCIWRPAEWVEAASYNNQREYVLQECDRAMRLTALLRRIAWTTPREGRLERHWRALDSQARIELAYVRRTRVSEAKAGAG